MFEILIVDDEVFARNAVIESIKSEISDIKLLTASDGEEALSKIENNDIDLVITDIKMPGLGGIELLTEIRNMNLKIKVVFLSSYNDFELTRKAIQLGACDYLFKPTMLPNDIRKVVIEVMQMKEQDQIEGRAIDIEKIKSNKVKDLFFSELINNPNMDKNRFDELVKNNRFDKEIKSLTIIFFSIEGFEKLLIKEFQNDAYLMKTFIINIVNEKFENQDKHYFISKNVFEYTLITWDTSENNKNDMEKANEAILKLIRKDLYENYKTDIFIGISSHGNSMNDFLRLYIEASVNCKINEEFARASNGNCEGKINGVALNDEMERAVRYINKNYADSDFSLQKVARYIGISKNYFSRIFKSTLGINFIDYLTIIRVRKARELYTTTDLKIYEIAEYVGYSDWHYLYKVYKKHMGNSLSQDILKD